MTYATYQDVVDRWISPEDIPATQSTVETLLEDAEDTVLREFPDIPTRIANGDLPVSRVAKIEARMVIRHLRNPGGVRSTQQGAGPYQQTVTFGGEEPGSLYLTEDDRRELRDPSSLKGKAFTVDSTPDYYGNSYVADMWWVEL